MLIGFAASARFRGAMEHHGKDLAEKLHPQAIKNLDECIIVDCTIGTKRSEVDARLFKK